MSSLIAVTQTSAGPRMIARGTCGCCAWTGVAEWDVHLEQVNRFEWEYDVDPQIPCPRCGVHEITLSSALDPPPGRD